jgi:hypothetical protein
MFLFFSFLGVSRHFGFGFGFELEYLVFLCYVRHPSRLWRYRALVAVVSAGQSLQHHVSKGVTFDDAWNACALQMFEMVRIHCIYSMITYFADGIRNVSLYALPFSLHC